MEREKKGGRAFFRRPLFLGRFTISRPGKKSRGDFFFTL